MIIYSQSKCFVLQLSTRYVDVFFFKKKKGLSTTMSFNCIKGLKTEASNKTNKIRQ